MRHNAYWKEKVYNDFSLPSKEADRIIVFIEEECRKAVEEDREMLAQRIEQWLTPPITMDKSLAIQDCAHIIRTHYKKTV